MRKVTFKQLVLAFGFLLLPTTMCRANGTLMADHFGHITIKEATVQEAPRGSSIHASIDGHYLTVAFTENLGQVAVEITAAAGGYVQTSSCLTPNGLQFYIPLAGDYIVTFTLPNGDEYYGEFTVTD